MADDFEDMEMDEFGFDDDFGDGVDVEEGGDRDPITANLKDAQKGLTESLVEDKVETAKEVGKHFLNSLSGGKTDAIAGHADVVIDKLAASKTEVGKAVSPLLDMIPADDSTTAGKYLGIAKNWLKGEESSGGSSESKADEALASANAFMEGLSLQDETQTKLAALQTKAYSEGTKAIISKLIDTDALTHKAMVNDSKYYHKSIELQFRSLGQLSILNSLHKEGNENIGKLLETISHNTALPDVVKAKSAEAIEAAMKQEMGKSLFSRFSKTDWMTNVSKNLSNKVGDITSKISGMAETILMPIDMVKSMEGMGSAGSMAGGMVGDSLKSQAGSRLGGLFGKTKFGSTVSMAIQNALADPNSMLSKHTGKDSIIGKLARGFKGLTKGSEHTLGEIDVRAKDMNEAAQFDNKTYSSINLVIPTLLGDILNEVKKVNGEEADFKSFDYEANEFITDSEKQSRLEEGFSNIFKETGKDVVLSNIVDDVLKHSKGTKLSPEEKELFLKAILDKNNSKELMNLATGKGMDIFNDLDDDTKDKFTGLMDNYAKDLNKDGELTDGNAKVFDKIKQLQNVTVDVDASKFIEDRIKNGYSEELIQMGIVEYDERGKRYIINKDKYNSVLGESMVQASSKFDKRDLVLTDKEKEDYLAKAKETGEDTSWLDGKVTDEIHERAADKAEKNSKLRAKVQGYEDKAVAKLDETFDKAGVLYKEHDIQGKIENVKDIASDGVDIVTSAANLAKLKAKHLTAKAKYETIEQTTTLKLKAMGTPEEDIPEIVKRVKQEAFKDMKDAANIYSKANIDFKASLDKEKIKPIKTEFELPKELTTTPPKMNAVLTQRPTPTKETLQDKFSNKKSELTDSGKKFLEAKFGITGDDLELLSEAVKHDSEKIAGAWDNVKEVMSNKVSNVSSVVGDKVGATNLPKPLQDKVDKAQELLNEVKDFKVGDVVDNVKDFNVDTAKDKAKVVKDKVIEKSSGLFSDSTKELITEAIEKDKEFYTNVWEKAKQSKDKFIEDTKEKTNKTLESIQKIGVDDLKSIAKDSKDKITNSVPDIDMDEFTKFMGEMKEKGNVHLDTVTGLLREGYGLPDIKKMFESFKGDETDTKDSPSLMDKLKGVGDNIKKPKFLDLDGDGFRANSWKSKVFGDKDKEGGPGFMERLTRDPEEKRSNSLITKVMGGIMGLLFGAGIKLSGLGLSGVGHLLKGAGGMAMGLVPKLVGGIFTDIIPRLFKGGKLINTITEAFTKSMGKGAFKGVGKAITLGLPAIGKGIGMLITLAGGGMLKGAGNLMKNLGFKPSFVDKLTRNIGNASRNIMNKAGGALSKIKGGKAGLALAGVAGVGYLINNFFDKEATVEDLPDGQKKYMHQLDLLKEHGIKPEGMMRFLIDVRGMSKEDANRVYYAHLNREKGITTSVSKDAKEDGEGIGMGNAVLAGVGASAALSYATKQKAIKATAPTIKSFSTTSSKTHSNIKAMDKTAKEAAKGIKGDGIAKSVSKVLGGKLSTKATFGLKSVMKKLPFVGAIGSGASAYEDIKNGDYGSAAANAALAVMQIIPATATLGFIGSMGKGVWDSMFGEDDKKPTEEEKEKASKAKDVKITPTKPSAEKVKDKDSTLVKINEKPKPKNTPWDLKETSYTPVSDNDYIQNENYNMNTDTDALVSSYKDAEVNIVTTKGISFNFTINDYDKVLLEQIAAHESKRGDAGYKVTYGNNRFLPYKNIDITKLAIKDVYKLMREQIRITKANISKARVCTSAMGKYQFLLKTLKEMVRVTKLSQNTLFSKSTQDYLILARLKHTRHYDDWIDGNLSDVAFVHNLSCEFASIEDPYKGGGKGHYAGQRAANKAKNFYKIFKQMRILMNKTDKPSASKAKSSSLKAQKGGLNSKTSSKVYNGVGIGSSSAKNPNTASTKFSNKTNVDVDTLQDDINELPLDKVQIANDMVRTKQSQSKKSKEYEAKDSIAVLHNIYGVNKEMLKALVTIANKEVGVTIDNKVDGQTVKTSSTNTNTSNPYNQPRRHVQPDAFKVDKQFL